MNKVYEGFSTHVTGITGMGKSWWVKKVLIPLLLKFKPVIIFDGEGEYSGRFASDADPDWNSYHSVGQFVQLVHDSGGIEKDVHVIFCESNTDWNVGLEMINDLNLDVSVIVDEAKFLFLDSQLNRARKSLIEMVRAGRKHGTDVVMISQRVMDMPPDIRSQFTRRISFHQQQGSDIKSMIDDNGIMEAEKVRDLGERELEVFGRFPDHLKMEKLK